MNLKIYKSLWGMTGSLEEQFKRIAEAGYNGIEASLPEIQDTGKFRELLDQYDLEFIGLCYTEGSLPEDHTALLAHYVGMAERLSAKKLVAHAGRDTMNLNEQLAFFEKAKKIEDNSIIPVAYETHRRRPFFSPMNFLTIMEKCPWLKVTADLSHWCCVTESMLEDHQKAIAIAAKNTIHIHARVGYENGPQVPDPRAPEWAGHLQKFESWWKMIIDEHIKRGEEELTVTPEYGPPSYMQTVPFDNKPVADLWDICLWSAERFRGLFATSR